MELGDIVELNEMVISGTVAPKRPMETPASISTIDPEQIKVTAPRSAPELISYIPGFYVESAGGEVRSNVRSRGLAASGGFFYAGLQEDGMQVVSENNLRGAAPDLFTRLTSVVGRVEAIRGGTSGVFQNNAPGGIINFINREGTPTHHGEITLQIADYHQRKGEFWVGGPIDQKTSYTFYSGYRRDNGPKDTGFPANDGYSIFGSIKHRFLDNRASLKVSAKWMDERNAFFFPIPLRDARDPKEIPGGVDIRNGTLLSSDFRNAINLTNTPHGTIRRDFADGSHIPLGYLTANLDVELSDDWKLTSMARYTVSDFDTTVLLPTSVAGTAQSFANSIGAAGGTRFATARASDGNFHYRLSLPGENGALIADPTALNGNGLAIQQLYSNSLTDLKNFQSDTRMVRKIGDKGGISAGLYTAHVDVDARTYGFTFVNEVRDNPRRLDFEFLDATTDASLGSGTYEGMRVVSAAGSYRNYHTDETNLAPYLNIEQSIGKWSFEGGVRYEKKQTHVRTEGNAATNINPAGEDNLVLRSAAFGDGVFREADYDRSATVWTTAVNYQFYEKLSSYLRFTRGYRMPISDDFETATRTGSGDPGPTNFVEQTELGLKYSTRNLAVFASLIHSTLADQSFAGVFPLPNGGVENRTYFRDAKSDSLELEVFYTPVQSLTFHLVGTAMQAEFTNDVFVSGIDGSGNTIAININGKRPNRIPNLFFTLGANYRLLERSWGTLSATFDWEYIGERKGDEANLTTLPSYDQLAVGLNLNSGRFTYRLHVRNIFDTAGFTEGDPRTAQLIGDPTAAYLNARTIFPRTITGSVTYAF